MSPALHACGSASPCAHAIVTATRCNTLATHIPRMPFVFIEAIISLCFNLREMPLLGVTFGRMLYGGALVVDL